MVNFYDEVEIEDMTWDDTKGVYHYPCPCGDRFEITRAQLADGFDQGICPSCSLVIRIVYDQMDFEEYAVPANDADADAAKDIKPDAISIANKAVAVAA